MTSTTFTILASFVLTQTAGGTERPFPVAVRFEATKPDAMRRQEIRATLQIEKNWIIYANKIDNPDFEVLRSTLKVTSETPLADVKIDYPPGELVIDKVVGNFRIYSGTIVITASVQRASDDPLDVSISVLPRRRLGNDFICGPRAKRFRTTVP
jgi:hypothetical protein